MTAALSIQSPSIVDVAKRTMNGKMVPIVEALAQKNALIHSMEWKEGNMDDGHLVSARNALPSVSWVRMNEGVAPSKSNVDNYKEGCGMLEGLSSIDKRVANLNGNAAEFRASEDDAFLAQMSNTVESAFFYESTKANPERILGLTPRLNKLGGAYGNQIIKGGGAGADNMSIWLVGWGPRSVYGIAPKGLGTGLKMEDKGEQRVLDSNNNVLWKYETLFHWNLGLCVEDYRNVVRICNIARSTLTKTGSTGDDLIDLMIQSYYQIFDPGSVRLAFYTNRTIASFLHRQAFKSTGNSTLSVDPAPSIGSPGWAGRPIVRCLGIPIYTTDALTIAETLVS